MKPILKVSTALIIILTNFPVAQAASQLNFSPKVPAVQIRPPAVRVPTNLGNASRALPAVQKDAQGAEDAGPQPEPPTRPASPAANQAAAPVRPWLPTSSPLPLPRIGGQAPRLVRLPGTVQGRDHAIEDENRTDDQPDDGDIGRDDTLVGARGPELDVPDGLAHMFDVTGGSINDLAHLGELAGLFAEIGFRPGPTGNPFEGPASMLGHPGFGAGMDGPPKGDGHGLNDGGVSSAGWQSGYSYQNSDTYGHVWMRPSKYGTDTFDRSFGPDGTMTVTITTHIGPNYTRTETIEHAEDGSFSGTYVRTVKYPNGRGYSETSSTSEILEDEDGDGAPDDVEDGEATADDKEAEDTQDADEEPGNEDAGGGSQAGDFDTASGGTGGCGVWTPFGGCSGTGPKVWETTGQPDPTNDGSGNVRSAGVSIGPEAVTNSGDGSFGPRGNTGGGGFEMDPCATVRGCGGPGGGGGPGPSGPAGS